MGTRRCDAMSVGNEVDGLVDSAGLRATNEG